MKKTRLSFFIFICFVGFIFTTAAISAANTSTEKGLYTTVDYTSKFFPEFEPLTVTFSVKRTLDTGLNSSYKLYMYSYRLVFNDTLLAYIDYSNETEHYIPEPQDINLEYDFDDLNINSSALGFYHRMVLETKAVGISEENDIIKIASDFIQVEVYLAREATGKEVITTLSIALGCLIVPIGIYFIRKGFDSHSFENITYRNMLFKWLRSLFVRKNRKEEPDLADTIKTETELELEAATEQKRKFNLKQLGNFSSILLDGIAIVLAYFSNTLSEEESFISLGLIIMSGMVFLVSIINVISVLRKKDPTIVHKEIVEPVEQKESEEPAELEKGAALEFEEPKQSKVKNFFDRLFFWRRRNESDQ